MNKHIAFLIFGCLLAGGCHPRAQQPPQPRELPVAVPESLEIPEYTDDEDVVAHLGYTASYNHRTLVSDWVAWELTADEANGRLEQQRNFSRDPEVRFPKASREDYSGTGWDKGHMAPHADMKWSHRAMTESDYFTNICPQNRKMNAGAWNKIEQLCRRLARRYGSVYIVTGPIFKEHRYGTIGDAAVMVPDRFFKALAVRVDGKFHTVAFLVENNAQDKSPRHYALTVDEVEALISRNLFPQVPEEAESTFEWKIWER